MTRDEYERRQQRLEEQHREGMALLEAAHRQQLRALELIWMTTAEEDLPVSRTAPSPAAHPPAPSGPAKPERRPAWALLDDIEEALPKLPEVFDRNDLCRALGYEPDRSSLFRMFQDLINGGILVMQRRGVGKTPTVYRKTGVKLDAPGA